MYTSEWAKNFKEFADNQAMDLQKFILFYEKYLTNKTFTYSTSSKKMPLFEIITKPNQLPHLMGLQYWNNIAIKQPEKQYKQLITGKWDIPFLKSADKGAFKEHGWRIEFLPHLYNLFYYYQCTVKLINPTTHSVFQRRGMHMVFQKENSKLVYFLELREIKENTFVPASISRYHKNSNALRFKSDPLQITNVSIKDKL